MAVTREEVLYLAKLSALRLSEDEVANLTGDIENIVTYFNQLQEIDTTDMSPLLQVIEGCSSPLVNQTELYPDPDWLLQNVHHQINHRNLVITNKRQTIGE